MITPTAVGFLSFYLQRENYWFLTNDGIDFLRTYLNLPSEIVPNTLKKVAQTGRTPQGAHPRGAAPGEFGGDEGGSPAEYQPQSGAASSSGGSGVGLGAGAAGSGLP
ncbi:hypothetical protein MKW92_000200 [Papaver armeniacum]|nr:hypothetical protein MKW92_000200 [Papaver armeniacum]